MGVFRLDRRLHDLDLSFPPADLRALEEAALGDDDLDLDLDDDLDLGECVSMRGTVLDKE